MLQTIFRINYRTTIPGILAIVAVIGKIGLAWRTKDLSAILSNGQELVMDIGLVLAGIGLITAKANNVIGAGTQAKAVDTSTGEVTDVTGKVVEIQPVK